MFRRGVALCSIFALATVAQGGVQVQLVPTPNLAEYPPNSVVQVDVKLVQAPGGADQRLRMVEFDMQTTGSLLTVALPRTHDRGTPGTGDDIYFWSFSSLNGCVTQPSFCGFNHFIDGNRLAGPVDTRVDVLSIAFYGLTADTQAQILLPASGAPVTVGKLQVTMPPFAGSFPLNLMNAADQGLDRGARVDFGMDPHSIWRARNAAPNDVTGGTLAFTVCSSDPCTGQNNVLTAASPAHNKSLWRTTKNIIKLTFQNPIAAPPQAGNILIEELLDGPLFGPNLAGSFAFTVNGNVLTIRDTTNTLVHRKWYGIRNTGGWGGVDPFRVDLVLQIGDANNNGRVQFSDLTTINTGVPTDPAADDDRRDINSDTRIQFNDMTAANARIPSDTVTKPVGHPP